MFLFCRYSLKRWWVQVFWHFWTHGDLVLEALVEFIAVFEHGLIPARVRGEWARLRAQGAASVWAPASQESSHVGQAGVGVVCMRDAPLSLPTSATAQCKRFFDCGRALRCMLASLVGIRNGLTLRSVGSNNMFLPVFF